MENKNNFHFYCITLLFAITLIVGCDKKEENQKNSTYTLSVSHTSLNFTASNLSQTFTITTDAEWKITGVPSWVSVSSTTGTGNTTITIVANANTATTSRNANLIITVADTTPIEINISQEAAADSATSSLRASTTVLIFTSANITRNFSISTTDAWTITGVPSWITLSATSGTGDTYLNVTAEENTTTSNRSADIFITVSGVTPYKINLLQAAAGSTNSLSIDIFSLNFKVASDRKDFFLSSREAWTITGVPSWVTLSATSGSGNPLGNYRIFVTVTENTATTTRFAELIITAPGAIPIRVFIGQDAAVDTNTFGLSGYTIAIPSAGGKVPITVYGPSGIRWTTSINASGASWLSVSPTSGSNSLPVDIIINPNNTGRPRTGNITFSSSGTSKVLTVIQQE